MHQVTEERLESYQEANTDFHQVTTYHFATLFSNGEVFLTRSVTFMLASIQVAAVPDTAAAIVVEPNLQKSESKAFILVVPAAYEEPSPEQQEVLPPFIITKEHAKQASHNYLVVDLEAVKVAEVVFQVNSQLIVVIAVIVRDFRISENFKLTESPRDLKVLVTAILFMAFSEEQEFAAMALAQILQPLPLQLWSLLHPFLNS